MSQKNKEMSTTNPVELDNKFKELKSELMKINTQIAIGTMLKSPGQAKQIKKNIARILTIKKNIEN